MVLFNLSRFTVLLALMNTIAPEDCQATRTHQRDTSDQNADGYYEVQCEEEDPDQYKKEQCWPGTKRCWCVDIYGAVIPNSHTNPGQDAINCETFSWCSSAVKSLSNNQGGNGFGNGMIGAHLPSCDEQGRFARSQFWGSTGERWCAVENGNKIPGTMTGPTDTPWDCDKLPPCLHAESLIAHLAVDEMYPLGLNRPECDGLGNYRAKQCHSSTGYCWCVNTSTGEEIEGTMKGPGLGSVECDEVEQLFNEESATACQKLYNVQKQFLESQEKPVLGMWQVSCETDGSFTPSQCNEGNCWCVEETGLEVPGTRSSPGQTTHICQTMSCSARKSMLEVEAASLMLVGVYTPLCEENGTYKIEQCWPSTGQCWCVTKQGVEIPYTRRSGNQASFNADCFNEHVTALLSQAAPNSLQAKPGPMSDGGMSSSEIRNDQRNTGLIAAVSVLAVALMVVLLLGVLFFYRTSHSNDDVSLFSRSPTI